MSINYFPTLYEDELLYSVLARYHIHSGNISYTQTASLLFENPRTSPLIEFIPKLTDNALSHLTKQKTMYAIIMEHTLFPYYGRFLPQPKRQEALEALHQMKVNVRYLIEMPRNTARASSLRYCPLCCKEDRLHHGETYWHRSHQLANINICPKHHCYLHDSSVKICGSMCSLIPAEQFCTSDIVTPCSDFESNLADYILSVFHSEIDMTNETPIGDFLQYKLIGTPYLHKLGTIRYSQKLIADFSSFYGSFRIDSMTTRYQFEAIFNGKRHTSYDICVLSYFLGISTNELSNPKLEATDLIGDFRVIIEDLLSKGYIYQQIAEITGVSRCTIQKILHPKEKVETKPKPNKRNGCQPADWKKIDTETLPLLKTTIKQLQNTDTPPIRITIHLISQKLNIPYKSLDNMPLCKAEILKHTETLEEYGARKLTWAFKKMTAENVPITYGRIQSYIYVKRQRLYKYMPYLDDEMKRIAENLM